jgi:NifU-like protein
VSWLERLTAGWGLREAPTQPRGDAARVREVQAVLDSVAPLLAADGGSVQLLAVDGGDLELRLDGACARCHASDSTMSSLIEPRLRAGLPWLQAVRWRR